MAPQADLPKSARDRRRLLGGLAVMRPPCAALLAGCRARPRQSHRFDRSWPTSRCRGSIRSAPTPTRCFPMPIRSPPVISPTDRRRARHGGDRGRPSRRSAEFTPVIAAKPQARHCVEDEYQFGRPPLRDQVPRRRRLRRGDRGRLCAHRTRSTPRSSTGWSRPAAIRASRRRGSPTSGGASPTGPARSCCRPASNRRWFAKSRRPRPSSGMMAGRKPVTESGVDAARLAPISMSATRAMRRRSSARYWRNERFDTDAEARIRKEFGDADSRRPTTRRGSIASSTRSRMPRRSATPSTSTPTRWRSATAQWSPSTPTRTPPARSNAVPAAKRKRSALYHTLASVTCAGQTRWRRPPRSCSPPRAIRAMIDGDAWWVERRIDFPRAPRPGRRQDRLPDRSRPFRREQRRHRRGRVPRRLVCARVPRRPRHRDEALRRDRARLADAAQPVARRILARAAPPRRRATATPPSPTTRMPAGFRRPSTARSRCRASA